MSHGPNLKLCNNAHKLLAAPRMRYDLNANHYVALNVNQYKNNKNDSILYINVLFYYYGIRKVE